MAIVEFRMKINEGRGKDFATDRKRRVYSMKCSNSRWKKNQSRSYKIYAYVMFDEFILAKQIVKIGMITLQERGQCKLFSILFL